MTKAEQIFMQRAALNLQQHPEWTIEQAIRSVVEDDQRISETLTILPDWKRKELNRMLSDRAYHAIRSKKGA